MAIQLNTNPVFLDPELAEILEYQRNINIGGGTNLAGQGGGGLLNRLRNQVQETDPYAYGSYVIPASDPTYSSGFNYARTIAGGMPFEDVVAPGMSFSPDQPMGYTQADLTPRFVGEGPAPVMPVAPTQGTPLTIEDQMPYAPVGTPTPTPFMGIPDYIKNLDFSNLPRFEDIRDIRGVGDIRPSLFDIDVEEILKDIDTEKFADIDLTNIDIPSIAPTMPQVPVQAPMNFTGLPQMPVMPNIPTMPQPIAPQPIPRVSTPLIPSFVQPNIEEIVRPIAVGKQGLPQYGLFNLV